MISRAAQGNLYARFLCYNWHVPLILKIVPITYINNNNDESAAS